MNGSTLLTLRHGWRKLSIPLVSLSCLTLVGTGCKQEEKPKSTVEEKSAPVETLPQEDRASSSEEKPSKGGVESGDAESGSRALAHGEEQDTVKLLSDGRGDKRVLRYAFAQGTERKFELNVEIKPVQSASGQQVPPTPPIVLDVFGTTEADKDADGKVEWQVIVQKVEPKVTGAPAAVVEQLAAQFKQMDAFTLLGEVTERGVVRSLEPASRNLNPQVSMFVSNLIEAMTNMFLPLPVEPVGVGAKWVATASVDAGGLSATQETTIEVTSLEGSKVTVDTTYHRHVPSRKVVMPGMPSGVKVELLKLEGSGTGSVRTDVSEFTVDARTELATQVDTRITQPGALAPVTQSVLTRMHSQVQVR